MILFRSGGVEAGESGITTILVAMVLLLWPATARPGRGQFCRSARRATCERLACLARPALPDLPPHVPNTLGVILVTLTFAIPTAIFTEAFLSFIGMGVAPHAVLGLHVL